MVRPTYKAGSSLSTLIFILSAHILTISQESSASTKSPSADIRRPVPLHLGEIVKGRLANSTETGKYHFWVR